jgi:hypothetical protein
MSKSQRRYWKKTGRDLGIEQLNSAKCNGSIILNEKLPGRRKMT